MIIKLIYFCFFSYDRIDLIDKIYSAHDRKQSYYQDYP